LNHRELTRKLRALGCEFQRHAKGDHEIWVRLVPRARTTIPNWGGRDLKPGTISRILRDRKISKGDFESA